MTFLRKRMDQNRPISDKSGKNYAPAVFAADPEAIAAKITNKMFETSMERLFEAGKICIKTWGPQSRPVRWINPTDIWEPEGSKP